MTQLSNQIFGCLLASSQVVFGQLFVGLELSAELEKINALTYIALNQILAALCCIALIFNKDINVKSIYISGNFFLSHIHCIETYIEINTLHTVMGGLIIRFHILICILYVMRDISTGRPSISELLQNY